MKLYGSIIDYLLCGRTYPIGHLNLTIARKEFNEIRQYAVTGVSSYCVIVEMRLISYDSETKRVSEILETYRRKV